MNIFLITSMTESGDEWNLVFKNKPSEQDVMDAIRNDPWLLDEFEADCLNIREAEEVDVIDN